MLKKNHALKVIIGFCGVIVLGLISLVIIDSFNAKEEIGEDTNAPVVDASAQVPPIKITPIKTNIQNKSTTQKAKAR